MELLTVVAVIGILAAATAPSFVLLLKDRRVTDAARHCSDLYRLARARAMGRGSAVLVRWNANAAMPTSAVPEGHFAMREAVTGPVSPYNARLPATSCLLTNWAFNSPTSTHVTSFDERRNRYKPAAAQFVDPTDNSQVFAEICFTPRGRTFVRYGANAAWAPMNGVPYIRMTNSESGMVRQVIIPPTGVARVETRIN